MARKFKGFYARGFNLTSEWGPDALWYGPMMVRIALSDATWWKLQHVIWLFL